MKRRIRFLTLHIILLIVMIGITKELTVQRIQASEQSEITYLNAKSKNLYLGISGKNKFDFNITKSAFKKVASYSWYIVENKGNPSAVTLDSKTGIVKAKSVGTAYIRCKITLTDKTVLKPEAKIIVINNITGVEINNIPETRTITMGTTIDFNEKILKTTAGKNVIASGITRWEIENDTAGVGNASEDGVIIPEKAGEFLIRAVCFQEIQDYEAWLTNKELKKDIITATSDWVTISVMSNERVATTQDQLNALLSDKNVKQITISADGEQKFSITEGDYSDKSLIVNAHNTDIINHGKFKLITFYLATNIKWEENSINNSLEIYDSIIKLYVTKKSQVASVKFGKAIGSTLYLDTIGQNLNINETSLINNFVPDTHYVSVNFADVSVFGMIDNLEVAAVSTMYLSGTGKIKHFVIDDTAKGTKIATAVATFLESYTDYIITLLNGAEGIKFDISTDSIATIENLSSYDVGVNYGPSNYMLLTTGNAIIIPYSGNTKSLGKINTSSVIKLYPTGITIVIGSTLNKGQLLLFSNLDGTFTYNSIKVYGNLTWIEPNAVVNTSGEFMWKFTPLDTNHFGIISGYAKVEIVD